MTVIVCVVIHMLYPWEDGPILERAVLELRISLLSGLAKKLWLSVDLSRILISIPSFRESLWSHQGVYEHDRLSPQK